MYSLVTVQIIPLSSLRPFLPEELACNEHDQPPDIVDSHIILWNESPPKGAVHLLGDNLIFQAAFWQFMWEFNIPVFTFSRFYKTSLDILHNNTRRGDFLFSSHSFDTGVFVCTEGKWQMSFCREGWIQGLVQGDPGSRTDPLRERMGSYCPWCGNKTMPGLRHSYFPSSPVSTLTSQLKGGHSHLLLMTLSSGPIHKH